MDNELRHYGVLGMKWGVRRYRDENGRLTSEGKKRYSELRKSQVQNFDYSMKTLRNSKTDPTFFKSRKTSRSMRNYGYWTDKAAKTEAQILKEFGPTKYSDLKKEYKMYSDDGEKYLKKYLSIYG